MSPKKNTPTPRFLPPPTLLDAERSERGLFTASVVAELEADSSGLVDISKFREELAHEPRAASRETAMRHTPKLHGPGWAARQRLVNPPTGPVATTIAQPSSRWLYAVTGLLSGAVVAVACLVALQPPPRVVVDRARAAAPTLEVRSLKPEKQEGETVQAKTQPAVPVPVPESPVPEKPAAKPKPKPRPQPKKPLPASLTTDQIKSALAPAKARAKTCGKSHWALPGEKVTVKLVISGNTGRVTSAASTKPSELGTCVAKTMKSAKTPRFAKATQTVVYSVRM